MSFARESNNEDKILAKVQEESLRYYREFELPRINDESRGVGGSSKSTPTKEDDGPKHAGSAGTTSGIVSMDAIGDSSVLCTQVGGKAGALLFEGDDAKGFHLAAGSTYIYPTNYPVRQYQSAIVRSALFKNTLVSLPTGLGKTFIAAVVMYNFYRWYPRGKVVFMAPTRPLVAQQIKACYSIMGIPPDDTTEMTGVQPTDIREKLWKEKRVFFLTPQVMANDLRSNICPASLVKCLVIDEAHKAVKDYAYCQVVKLLAGAGSVYRTLALSATPGSDINAVIQVIRNLNISCLEMRGENSIDVAPYTHGKSIENVVVDLSPELMRVKDDFMQVYEKFARSLIENRALTSNIAYLSKFQILKSMEKFRANPPRGMSTSLIGSLVSDFTMCMTFAHALELLQIYGLRAFYRSLADETGEKSKAATTRLRNNEDLQRLLQKLHGILYPKPGSDVPYTWGHPKLKKLVHSLSDHFKTADEKGEKTKAIVFCQYKAVVSEIVDLLGKCKPHVQAALFVGQSGGKERGMPQSKQLQIMKDFREGKINCLVATCVAEEGLDIGEVDLIVLMESQKSPVRLVQRLGRTGRKRRGRCVVLLTKGKEEGKFHDAMASRKSYVQNIVESKAVKNSLCQYSPPMFPPGTKPSQQLVHIKVTCVPTPTKPEKATKKQMDIRDCAVVESRPFLDDEEAKKIEGELGKCTLAFDQLPSKVELWSRRSGPAMRVDELLNGETNQLAYWSDWNTEVHKSYVISNTFPSETYCHLMSYDVHQEDDEYLKLMEAYDGGTPLHKERKGGHSKANDAPEEENEERKNKTKKKTAPKKNYGMDIRSCMAAVVPKPHKRPRLDSTEDDVIIVQTEDDVPDRLGAETRAYRDERNCEVDLSTAAEQCVVGKRRSASSREELDVAGIFGMEADEFEDALYSENMLCGLEADIGMCLRLGKIFSDPPVAPKPKLVCVDVFKFQCDQLLKLMDTVSGLTIGPVTAESSRSPAVSEKPNCGTSPIETQVGDLEDNNKIGFLATKHDSFVDVDDLFGDDDVFTDVDLNCGSFGKRENPPSHDKVCTPLLEKQENSTNDNVQLSPIQKNSELPSVWGSNSVLAELSPIGKAPPQVDGPIISSTPINPRRSGTRRESPLAQPAKDQPWLLDDILEEDEESSKDTIPSKYPSDPQHSSKDLFATTPGSKVLEKAEATSPKASKAKSDSDEDYWCLDDLFEDQIPEDTNRDPRNETTFYGITQMVSQIERDKLQNRENNAPGVDSEISCSKGALTPENGLLSPKLQAKVGCPRSPVRLSSPPNYMVIPSIHILDSDSVSEIPDKNAQPTRKLSTARNSPQEDVPIVLIDSDSCSPPVFVENDDKSVQNKSKLSKKSGEASIRLLDEDDDVFNVLCNDGFVDAKLNTSTSKQTPRLENIKKFKRKGLLCHLDSEPENDFPPEDRSKASDETFHLRVGSSSKRKLSFEDLLEDVGNGDSSKCFASNPPKEPDKPALKVSCLPASVVSMKRITRPTHCSPSEEDTFIPPITGNVGKASRVGSAPPRSQSLLQGKSHEDVPKRQASPPSSTSVSPVKVTRRKKGKRRHKRKGHAFIENEADESGTASTDDSDNSSLDDMDDSFVNDESDQELSYAHYLKTLKSPVAGGKFKIPANRRYMGNVYSQAVNNMDDDYENDSFCVDSDEGNSPEQSTILERSERKLAKKRAGPTKKRIIQAESGDSDCDERVADLNNLTCLPVSNRLPKKRLLESDSDVTPERPQPKRPRNRIVSPIEGEKTPTTAVTPTTTADCVLPVPEENRVLKTASGAGTTVKIDSDSDEDLKEAIRLSKMESAPKKTAEEQFEEDLQKALLLSQCEVAGPSKPVGSSDSCPSPGDRGTSLLFTSQPILPDRKLLSTKNRPRTKPSSASNKVFGKVFELSDSD